MTDPGIDPGDRPAARRRYLDLAAQISEPGFISQGSVTRRFTTCSTPSCRCHADPPQRPGPYYQEPEKLPARPSPAVSLPARPSCTNSGSPTDVTSTRSSRPWKTCHAKPPNSSWTTPHRPDSAQPLP